MVQFDWYLVILCNALVPATSQAHAPSILLHEHSEGLSFTFYPRSRMKSGAIYAVNSETRQLTRRWASCHAPLYKYKPRHMHRSNLCACLATTARLVRVSNGLL